MSIAGYDDTTLRDERGVDLEVEGVRYIEMHRGPHTHWARLLQGAEIFN